MQQLSQLIIARYITKHTLDEYPNLYKVLQGLLVPQPHYRPFHLKVKLHYLARDSQSYVNPFLPSLN